MHSLNRLVKVGLAVFGLGFAALAARAQQPLPEVDVTAPRPAAAPEQPQQQPGAPIPWSSDQIQNDGDRVGTYNQPVWTTQRPFTAVRTYVLPEGQMQVEQWYRPRWLRDGSREDRVLEEYSVGLPCRFQLDLYERWHIEKDAAGTYAGNHEGTMIELRWAFANWDVIPLNPTIYLEWVQRGNTKSEPDKYEIKLLLAESLFNDKLFWAGNFILEQEVGGEKETELGYSQAIAFPIIQRKLMGGMEMIFRSSCVHGDRGTWSNEFLVGPTMQWRPTNRTFVDVTGLFGVTKGAPQAEMYVIFGYQFGKRAGPSFGGITPTSLGN